MRAVVVAAAAAALLASASAAVADQRGDHHQGGWGQDQGAAHHWQRGERMGQDDWNGAQPVDYRAHHLRHPPRGYEWRQSNGQYVLAAVVTGVIAATILSEHH
ncbi:MAG TPA: RcnB family protein [Caulobacteraceae bacterium]|nr:RcnB family protein [Caulobacteraceae bacterium]